MLERVVAALTPHGAHGDIPLQFDLWNGQHIALGPNPRVTIRLPTPQALKFFVKPSLDKLAEGYVNHHFDVLGRVQDVVQVAGRLAEARVGATGRFGRLFSPVRHSRTLDRRAISHHYDVSNDFYRLWLDSQMVYSCAYFPNATGTLEQAQMAKLDHVLNKIMLKPGERLLDIGCGWGALAMRAASQFGARVVGVTLSRQQFDLARERVAAAGLQGQVDIRLQDYRELDAKDGRFDKITSIGMFEHVGLRHLAAYFSAIHALLDDGGLALNHGITSTDPDSGSTPLGAAQFIDKYVFPQGELPHISLALQAMQRGGLEVLDVECLRRHYAKTLGLWAQNYEDQSSQIARLVDDTTFRVWRIYLAGCAWAFEQNWVSLYQVLVCKAGTAPGLNSTPWSRGYMYGGGSAPVVRHPPGSVHQPEEPS